MYEQLCGRSLDIGLITVLQTAGRSGAYNPHLHILLTEGGVTSDKTWRTVSYIPFLSSTESGSFICSPCSKRNISGSKIKEDINKAWTDYPKGFVAFVHKEKVPPGAQGLAKYLAKYLVSPPISVRRIEQYDGQFVTYWYRDHKTHSIVHETIPVLEFIGRMGSAHSAERVSANSLLRTSLQCTVCSEQKTARPRYFPATRPFLNPAFVCNHVNHSNSFSLITFGHSPFLCPNCNSSMELELITHPDYGILRSYELFEETPKASPSSKKERQRSSFQRPQPMVQLSLSFM